MKMKKSGTPRLSGYLRTVTLVKLVLLVTLLMTAQQVGLSEVANPHVGDDF